jgi:adenine phosphoribosyltransferase
MEHLKELIRTVPNFPEPGIKFYDITTLLKNASAFQQAIDALVDHYNHRTDIDLVVGIEARGFIFASIMAYQLKAGFVPVRKPKKLPADIHQATYDLEYGKDGLEIHRDAITAGQRVLVIDDLLATGGTAAAVGGLIEKMGGSLVGYGFLVELDSLQGRKKLGNHEIHSVLKYQE